MTPHHEGVCFLEAVVNRLSGVNARIEELTTQNRSVYELLRAKEDRKTEKITTVRNRSQGKIDNSCRKKRDNQKLKLKKKGLLLPRSKKTKKKRRTAFYGVMIALVGILVTVIEPALSWSQIVGAIADFTNTLIEKS